MLCRTCFRSMPPNERAAYYFRCENCWVAAHQPKGCFIHVEAEPVEAAQVQAFFVANEPSAAEPVRPPDPAPSDGVLRAFLDTSEEWFRENGASALAD